MKFFVASDIHGSAYYCDKLIRAFNEEKADRLILLGDILYHGPRNDLPRDYNPKAVIEMLNNIKESIFCVRGNCDAEVDLMVLDFPFKEDYALIEMQDCVLYATHGHIYNQGNMPPAKEGDVVLYGHTHIPKDETVRGVRFINPGSVSIPKAGSAHSYIVWENNTFIWKHLT